MQKVLRAITILSFVGVLFAGSVTLRQYISPATEPGIFSCVGFKVLGLSPCPYGLALFVLLFLISALMLFNRLSEQKALPWLRLTGVGGVAFSGWVVWRELGAPALALGASYWDTFSFARVPACAWGFLVFLAVGILVFVYRAKRQLPM